MFYFKSRIMGRKKEKVYVYRANGSRYMEFESESDFSEHFSLDSNYMSRNRKVIFGEDVVKVREVDLFACNNPIGKLRIKNYVKKINSKFIRYNNIVKTDRPIGCFNLEDELICCFKDKFYALAILGKGLEVHSERPKHIKKEVYYKYI